MTTVLLVSFAAAACFGVASVLQHDGARRARRRAPLHPGLIAELAQRPGWLLGAAAQLAGVALHLCAVNLGPLSVVQPVLTVGLVIALGVQRLAGRRVSREALLAAALVVAGLVAFLAALPDPDPSAAAGGAGWLPGLMMAGLVLTGTLVAGCLTRGSARAACLGASAGTLMATSAALGKAWGTLLRADGLPALLSGWQLWAALACGFAGLVLSQTAFQAGPLGGPLAAMMAIDPAVGVGLGVVVFNEPLAADAGVLPSLAGLLLTLLGVVLLARVQRVDADPPRPGSTPRTEPRPAAEPRAAA